MVRHDHKTGAASVLLLSLIAQLAQHDPFGLIVIEQSAAAITREGDEVRMPFLIEDSSSCHADIVAVS